MQESAVARPWERKFLGYTCTVQRKSRLRIAPESVKRLKQKVRERLRPGRGRSLRRTIKELNPLLRGWINDFQLTQTKGVLDEFDQWLRRRLRCLLWRQWKKPRTRVRKLLALGLDAERAHVSAGNGHGPWWNASASHMNEALPARHFTQRGWSRYCMSCSDSSVSVEPPYAEPHVRWCERAAGVTRRPTRSYRRALAAIARLPVA